tara:strand:- start:439 stop:1362 length:924 start_codon:yes stop_codon:yes gene_type:complete
MPGHTRTIYSRRQRMASGQYDTPLADFLDRLPDYFNQYQQNQLAIDRQKLAEKRYDDAIERQKTLDEQRKNDREYQREVNFINMVPDDQKGIAMSKSTIPEIKKAGDAIVDKNEKFNNLIYPIDTESTDYEESLKTAIASPNFTPSQKKMIGERISKLNNQKIFNNAQTLIDNLPDGPDKTSFKIRLQSGDVEGVLKEINKRESKKQEELSPADQFTNQLISQPNQIQNIIDSIDADLNPRVRKSRNLPPLTKDQIEQRVELRKNLVNSRFDLIQPLIQGFAPPKSAIVAPPESAIVEDDKFLQNFD